MSQVQELAEHRSDGYLDFGALGFWWRVRLATITSVCLQLLLPFPSHPLIHSFRADGFLSFLAHTQPIQLTTKFV